MKYLLFFTLLLVGCSDADICQGIRGSRAFFGHPDIRCTSKGFYVPSECENFCNSHAQGYVGVRQDSMGVCICDNEEGKTAATGYHAYLNNQCKVK